MLSSASWKSCMERRRWHVCFYLAWRKCSHVWNNILEPSSPSALMLALIYWLCMLILTGFPASLSYLYVFETFSFRLPFSFSLWDSQVRSHDRSHDPNSNWRHTDSCQDNAQVFVPVLLLRNQLYSLSAHRYSFSRLCWFVPFPAAQADVFFYDKNDGGCMTVSRVLGTSPCADFLGLFCSWFQLFVATTDLHPPSAWFHLVSAQTSAPHVKYSVESGKNSLPSTF